jgi:hypothetical protein
VQRGTDNSSDYLGHRPYLDYGNRPITVKYRAKAEGESSMVEKPGCSETVKRYARQDPDGKVKAGLLEPKCPICNIDGSGKTDETGCVPEITAVASRRFRQMMPLCHHLKHSRDAGWPIAISRIRNGRLNRPIVNRIRNTRWPNRREPQGYGVLVVVSGRESRLHGEGGQVSRVSGDGGMRNADS